MPAWERVQAVTDTLDSLRAERDEARETLRRSVEWIDAWRVAREAEIARYREALAPFAAAYLATLPSEYGGTADPSLRVTLADCMVAAQALEGE